MTHPTQLPETIAVTTPKGGVGKTTTLSGLAIFLANQKKKVLLIDLDNIASLTNNFQGAGIRYPELSNVTHLFTDPEDGAEMRVSVISDYIHMIQGDAAISDINRSNDITIVTQMKENLLAKIPDIESYDYLLIDTPAGNGNTLLASLICANKIYSPIDLDHNAISSLQELTKVLKPIRRSFNKELTWVGFVINRVPKLVRVLGVKVPEAKTDRVIYQDLVAQFGDSALLGVIATRNPIKSAISSGRWITGTDESAQEGEAEFKQFCTALMGKK
jgi:cellulose biosynthesis protein BcsQ